MGSRSPFDIDKLANFTYVKSSYLRHKMRIKINSLVGTRKPIPPWELFSNPVLDYSPWAHENKHADLKVECHIFDGNKPYSVTCSTAFKVMNNRWDWYEWIDLPVNICDLPRNSMLVFIVKDWRTPNFFLVGVAHINVFDENGVMNTGTKELRLHVSTPKSEKEKKADETADKEIDAIEKLMMEYRRGVIPPNDWMDAMSLTNLAQKVEKIKKECFSLYLSVQFPIVDWHHREVAVLYHDGTPFDYAINEVKPRICNLYDPAVGMENLTEKKHLALARSLRNGMDRPNAGDQLRLTEIMDLPPTVTIQGPDLDLLWKYRYYLITHEAGLAKFLKCVQWNQRDHVTEAKDLLSKWVRLQAETALQLLGPTFKYPGVRSHAVSTLDNSDDDVLMLYLLQLVQALRYEDFDPNVSFTEGHYGDGYEMVPDDATSVASNTFDMSSIAETVVQDHSNGNETDQLRISTLDNTKSIDVMNTSNNNNCTDSDKGSGLLELLIRRATSNVKMATALYWYLKVECDTKGKPSKKIEPICLYALNLLMSSLREGDAQAQLTATYLVKQQELVDKLTNIMANFDERLNREQKVKAIRKSLGGESSSVYQFDQPFPLVLDPSVMVTGIELKDVRVYKSAMAPALIAFNTVDGGKYKTIFKHGDDLRQDQLILQLIALMDRLLLAENLDLKLTPYRALATSASQGFVQFIDSFVIADVLRKDGSLLAFFRRHHPDPDHPLNVSPQVLSNYIHSCAGYSIITYILGVGDRHHDNLVITTDGCFFHIDFGYFLGRDPKPLPPLIKLSREMIDGFGGQNSDRYHQFLSLCRTAFLSLRRHAPLVLSLLSLMLDSGIPDIALEPERAVDKVAARFHLDVTDEEASAKILSVIRESANDIVGAVTENIHKFTRYIRN